MKKQITYCDVCNKEIKTTEKQMPVIFTTEQTEGISCKPYLEFSKIDICEACDNKVLDGNFIYGSGAQGYNQYKFRNLPEIEQLRHFKATVVGLWATDRPDLFTNKEKEKFHLFRLKSK